MSVATPTALQTSLQVQGYSRLLQEKQVPEDIFVHVQGIYESAKKTIPDAIYLKVNDVESAEHTHKLGMVMPLSGTPTYGNVQNQVGREENQVTKSVTIYKNDYSHAVTNQLFGIDAQDKRFYQLLEKETEQLGMYFKELEGLHIRQALLERYSENLHLALPTSANCTRQWSPNWYIKNVPDNNQPAFHQTNQTFTNRIVQAMNIAGTGAAARIDFHYLAALTHYAQYVRLIKQTGTSGTPTYIVTVPARQAVYLKDPTVTGSFGAQWVNYNRLTDKEMSWPNVLGRFGPLLLVEDPRSPTVLPSGTAAPYTLTAGYYYPGNNDQRSTNANARDIGFLLGQAALVKWDAEKLHFEIEQALTYNKRRGHGAFGTYGIQQVQYDTDTPTSNPNTREQFGSIALAFARYDITA